MTDMLRSELEDRLSEAESSGDQKRINAARRAIDRATLECQAHTAERVKKIEKDAAETRQDVRDIKTSIAGIATSRAVLTEKYDATTLAVSNLEKKIGGWEQQARGARRLWDLLKFVAGAGGGALIVKALGA